MALLLKPVQLNDEYLLENGYARITDIQYSWRTSQPSYELTIYKSKEDREIEKQKEAVALKYLNHQGILDYLRALSSPEKEETKALLEEVCSGKNLYLGTAASEFRFLSKEVITKFKKFIDAHKFESLEVLLKDCKILQTPYSIPLVITYGGMPQDYFTFDQNTIIKAYDFAKQINSPLMQDPKDA